MYNCKLFVVRIVIWSYNCLLRIIISYLKTNSSVQINGIIKLKYLKLYQVLLIEWYSSSLMGFFLVENLKKS